MRIGISWPKSKDIMHAIFSKKSFSSILAPALVWALLGGACLSGLAADPPADIDWNRARQLNQRAQKGETLTSDESAYLARAKEARRQGITPEAAARANSPAQAQSESANLRRARALLEKQNNGQSLTDEEKSFVERMKEQRGRVRPPAVESEGKKSVGLIPLIEMSAQDRYKDEDGGLYGGGQNVPPTAHALVAAAESARIRPLDADGKPSPDGKIGLLSIGMSNTTQEYSKFKELADADPDKAASVVVVDGAQGGQDAAKWNDDQSGTWRTVEGRLRAAGITGPQVQVVWMKHARIGPARFGEYPKHAEELADHIIGSLQIAKKRFPNLRVVYLSSRIYAGYAATQLNPEPYAYESALAVRRVILSQIKADPRLNYDRSKGEVKAPLLLWGPYLWADGMTPRKADALVWKREDLGGDGTHPSPISGREKVARLLLAFLKVDPYAKPWFVRVAAK